MQRIQHSVALQGSPDEVFQQLSHVPNFTRFCDHVKRIDPLGDDHWRWTVEILGKAFRFDVAVAESQRPSRFAWQSLRGIRNRGAYHLVEETPGHTRVNLEIEYELGSALLEIAARRAAGSLVARISGQMLERVQRSVDAARRSPGSTSTSPTP